MKKMIAMLLALSLLLALCACGNKAANAEVAPEQPAETTEPEQPAEAPAEEPAETPAEEPAETEEPAEEPAETEEPEGPQLGGVAGEGGGYWYELANERGEYTDGSGNVNAYSYAIPAFNVDSADASRLNDAIQSYCQGFVDEMLEAEQLGASLMTLSVGYEAALNGEIASILITVTTDYDFCDYRAFNLNVATGAEATDADLIAYAGLSEDAFIAAAKQAASDAFEAKYGALEGDPAYQEQYDKTMSADMFSMKMPAYLDGAGSLKVIVPVYSMAGAEYYYEILTIQ